MDSQLISGHYAVPRSHPFHGVPGPFGQAEDGDAEPTESTQAAQVAGADTVEAGTRADSFGQIQSAPRSRPDLPPAADGRSHAAPSGRGGARRIATTIGAIGAIAGVAALASTLLHRPDPSAPHMVAVASSPEHPVAARPPESALQHPTKPAASDATVALAAAPTVAPAAAAPATATVVDTGADAPQRPNRARGTRAHAHVAAASPAHRRTLMSARAIRPDASQDDIARDDGLQDDTLPKSAIPAIAARTTPILEWEPREQRRLLEKR